MAVATQLAMGSLSLSSSCMSRPSSCRDLDLWEVNQIATSAESATAWTSRCCKAMSARVAGRTTERIDVPMRDPYGRRSHENGGPSNLDGVRRRWTRAHREQGGARAKEMTDLLAVPAKMKTKKKNDSSHIEALDMAEREDAAMAYKAEVGISGSFFIAGRERRMSSGWWIRHHERIVYRSRKTVISRGVGSASGSRSCVGHVACSGSFVPSRTLSMSGEGKASLGCRLIDTHNRSKRFATECMRRRRLVTCQAYDEHVLQTALAVEEDDQSSFLNVEKPPSVFSRIMKTLEGAGAYLPHVVLASTILAFVRPDALSWFTNKYYAPSLGFLMFAVGLNLSIDDFRSAFRRPDVIAAGYAGQFVVKPILGFLLAALLAPMLGLPDAMGSGIILLSCVSGAQLSNYATYLVHKQMAPLSIVMTALSTASAAVVTPVLTLLLLGKRLPVNVPGMIINITQIVLVPVTLGLLLNRFAAPVSRAIRPLLPVLSAVVSALCVGSPLSINIDKVRSASGLALLVPILIFHAMAHVCGYYLAKGIFARDPDRTPISRTISFVTGMQSSLLGLALANRFFDDPLVGLPSAISVVVMSLSGFGLVLHWNREDSRRLLRQTQTDVTGEIEGSEIEKEDVIVNL